MKFRLVTCFLSFSLTLLGLTPLLAQADIKLAPIFLGSPILQRDMPVPLWGTAEPDTSIFVSFNGQEFKTQCDASGKWRIVFAPMPANDEGQELIVSYGIEDEYPLVREDVLVGDIWLGAGQSNMELGISVIANRNDELKDTNYPNIRIFLSPKMTSAQAETDLLGAWLPANRANLNTGGWKGFSAVGFTFARAVYKASKVPQGIMQTAYGGSAIEQWLPQGDIWNAMVAPLRGFALRGILWYQGETNAGDGPAYTAKMEKLIKGYRDILGQNNLPFYFVQIAPWGGYGGSLPALWAAQEKALAIPNTAMVVTLDIGDEGDIHPVDKRPVGDRLALHALKNVYGQSNLLADSPYVEKIEPVQGKTDTLLLQYAFAGTGLITKDGKAPSGFELSADGKLWYSAQASILGSTVQLTANEVKKPLYARYAWKDFPKVNLTNSAGLPARPWKGNAP